MMKDDLVYADTSFLLSLYITDSNTPKADAQMEQAKVSFYWSPFHQVEFDTALESRVRRGQTSREQADQAHAALKTHREVHGIYWVAEVAWDAVWARAIALAGQKASQHLCRTLDIVHLALAMEVGAEEFYSFDSRQNTLAAVLDLRTLSL